MRRAVWPLCAKLQELRGCWCSVVGFLDFDRPLSGTRAIAAACVRHYMCILLLMLQLAVRDSGLARAGLR